MVRLKMNGPLNTNSKEQIALDFIDPLFAIVIGLGFEAISREPTFTGSYLESLFYSPQTLFGKSESFTIAVTALAYLTVVSSWIGYHRSVLKKNIRITTTAGLFRFGVDIILLGLYWLLLVNFENFPFEMLVLLLVYVFFVPWDLFKWQEYKPEEIDSRRRRGVSVVWALIFLATYLLYVTYKPQASPRGDLVDWIVLTVAIVWTVLYRVHKERPKPSALMSILAITPRSKSTSKPL